MRLVDSLRESSRSLFPRIAERIRGLSADEVVRKHGVEVVQDLMKAAEHEAKVGEVPATGAEKKAAVIAILGEFYDQFIEPIDLPGPDRFVDPLLKSILLKVADYLIDGLASVLFRKSEAA